MPRPSADRRLAPLPFALALALSPVALRAEPVSYDFAEIAYAADGDVRGGSLRGSVDFGEAGESGWYAHGSAFSLSGDEDGIDLDRRVIDVGAGYRHAVGDFWAVEGEVAWRDDAIERNRIDLGDAGGLRVSVGVRGSVSERVEVRAMAGAFDAGDRGTEAVGELGVHVYATRNIGFTTDVQFGDGGEVLRIGMRVRF